VFRSILIANRGEIAVRIIATARRLGLRTIAVYSDADAEAPHVRLADVAVPIGPAPAAQSYLSPERILAAARSTGAECIHPGYGFLSENAAFAEACAAAGVVFVGPPPAAIRAMGLKDGAKALMESHKVPVVPGYHGERQDPEFLKQKAYEIGYPVLIKAVAGGGGKGMRRVDRAIEFEEALAAARREAEASFGDPRVLVERYVRDPRHIEFQVFADTHGNAIHLNERDCSIQRRHQKVLEEAPAPGMTAEVRAAMGAAAVAAAKAVGYVGAGTVEFIVDGAKGLRPDGFWFMEMNTRLQVEHPVTEAITGFDLVEWQLRVAAGEPLPSLAAPIGGHAVEVRLYAEDPDAGFLPSSGRLDVLRLPQGEGIRVDSGVEEGGTVAPFYDPMIAKIIAHGADRREALDRLSAALSRTVVAGPKSNLAFLRAVVGHADVRAGGVDTGFVERAGTAIAGGRVGDAVIAAAVVRLVAAAAAAARPAHSAAGWTDPWSAADGFALGPAREVGYRFTVDGGPPQTARLRWGHGEVEAFVGRASSAGVPDEAFVRAGAAAYALDGGRAAAVRLVDELARTADDLEGSGVVRAPMHGRLIAVRVAAGERVTRGAPLFAVEAMKMEHTVLAPRDGVVAEVRAAVGAQVAQGAAIVVLAEGEGRRPD
jgi:3-methylcrotonyl-CoA carboxylase alpha subunit